MGLLVQCPLGHIFSQLRSQNRNLSAILSDFRCVLGRVLHRFERSSTYTHGMSVNVLDREMFTEAEAARLLRVPQRTLNYWLEGGEYRGRIYRPVIRVDPRGGHAVVTWAEFVEAGLLREYR